MKISVIVATVVVAAALPMYSTAARTNGRFNDATECTNVAVQGDATFCVAGLVCAGDGGAPSGKSCPQAKAVAISGCSEGLKSYDTKSKTCVAPVGSTCMKLATGGVWGCTWDTAAAPTVTPSAAPTPLPTTKAPTPTTTAPAPATTAPIPTTTAPAPTTKAPSPTTTAPAPTTKAPPVPPAPGCTTVSVEGDAIFCIKGPVCSGWGATPVATLCPKVGDAAIDECFDDMKSYDKKSNSCVAPVTSSCKKVTSGAWGCVWNLPSPGTPVPTTKTPVTPGPTTKAPATPVPTTKAPVTPGPTTKIPVTSAPGVTKPPTIPGCATVSVEGDAIFCIKGPVCSGSGASPSGTLCPKVGDWAVDECYDDMKSYNKKDDYCVAPLTSSCKKVTSGAWGCVWDLPAPVTPAVTTKAPVVTPATTTKAPAVTPAVTTPATVPAFPTDCIDVSVEGDATFCITGPICSGSGASPAGTSCPKVGDYAIDDCYDYLKSGKSNSTYCIAPVDASCKKIKSGAWGCVWNAAETATVSTKTSLAAEGAAGATANSVGAIAGCVAAALAVAGVAFAAVVNQRKKRQEQEQHQKVAGGQFIGMTQSPAVFRG